MKLKKKKKYINNNFDVYSTIINPKENYGFVIENIIKEEKIFIDEEKKKKKKENINQMELEKK